jgi:beta-lactamase superfamily II metal-dependent hydrolase
MTRMTLEIVFWDVQHGNATYIKTPNGTHIVQDLGTGSYGMNNKGFSPLLHLKNTWRVSRLDYVIITHPHRDHIADIMNFDELNPRVLNRPRNLPKDNIIRNIRQEDRDLFDEYFKIDQRFSERVPPNEDPKLSRNNGGVNIQVFRPSLCSTSNLNNQSSVTVLSYANRKVILPGDNEPPSWEELLEKEDFKNAIRNSDILLAPHHGRESGYFSKLFEHFKPKLTIISDGRFCDTSATNRYSRVSSGWTVHHRSGKEEERYCVTTRNDGVIVVKLGYNSTGRPFIEVTID